MRAPLKSLPLELPEVSSTVPSNAAPGTPSVAAVERIAVVRPNHRLGNTLLLTPLLQELGAHFPSAQIEVITASGDAAAVFERYPKITNLQFPVRSYEHPLQVLALLGRLRRRRYDLAIDPMPRQRAGRFLLGWLRARDRLGYRWGVAWRDRALTHAADASGAPRHFAHLPLYLLRTAYLPRIGVPSDPSAPMAPLDLRLTPAERAAGADRLAAALRAAGVSQEPAPQSIALFAHATGQKGWSIEWWLQLIKVLRIKVPGARLIEIVPADRQPRLASVTPGLYTPQLRLLGATLAASSLLVIPDGGVLHLAEAGAARVLALFKTTDPSQYGPTRPGSEALWAPELSAEAVAASICALLERTPRKQAQR